MRNSRNRFAILAAALVALFTLGGSIAYANTGPKVNGLHWQQQQTTATPVDDPVVIQTLTLQSVGLGSPYTSPTHDIRAYASYGLKLNAEDGTYAATDQLSVTITFYADAAATIPLFIDKYTIFKTNILGSAPFRLTGQALAGWMTVALSDPNATGNNVNVTYNLVGSFRALTNTYLRMTQDGELYSRAASLAAAATDATPAKIGYGRAMAVLLSGAVGPATMEIRLGGTGVNSTRYLLTAGAANTRVTQEIVLPRQQAYVVLTNTSGGLQTVRANIFQQVDPY
jgi:hypothetical protein